MRLTKARKLSPWDVLMPERRIPGAGLPSKEQYLRAFYTIRREFPNVRYFGSWDEANDGGQPTRNEPLRAGKYYRWMTEECNKPFSSPDPALDRSKDKNGVAPIKCSAVAGDKTNPSYSATGDPCP